MSSTLFETGAAAPRGRVLVAHGLNTRPSVMDPLIRHLCAAGLSCLRVSLHPSHTHRASARTVRHRWLATISEAHDRLVDASPSRPVHALGYSLGALVCVAHLASSGARFDRMVLLAPPFALTRTASTVRGLTPLAGTGLALPSAAPAEVRLRRATPLSEYAALLSLVSDLQQLPQAQRLRRIPTLVLVDAADELVSARGVEGWIAANGLTAWSIERMQERRATRRTCRHMVLTEETMGAPAWHAMTDAVTTHLAGPDLAPG